MKIEVLLSTWNGEKYLDELLDSLIQQTYQKFHITILDDKSSDKTKEIIQTFIQKYPEKITLLNTDRKFGYPDCFWYLIEKAPIADMYAYCDQDDVWDKNKFACCYEHFSDLDPSVPALYVHDYSLCDSNMNKIGEHHMSRDGFDPNNPYNLIYYVMSSGFTMIINNALRIRILRDNLYGKKIFHDRWTFWAAFFSGTIIYDSRILVNYRRHDQTATETGKGNLVLLKVWLLGDIFGNNFSETSKIALFFADCYRTEMNKKDKNIEKNWRKIAGEGKGIYAYLSRLFTMKKLKPNFSKELILRLSFLLNKK